MNETTAHELARKLSILEERMNTKQAEYQTDIARLAEQMAQRDVRLAERDAKQAEREIANTRWIIGVIVAMSLLIIAAIRL